MECEELHDALNNSELSEQEIPLEDFGDCKLKSKLYVGMQFDSLDGVETFYKEFAKKEDFGTRIHTSKRAPKSDNVTSRIYVCCVNVYYVLLWALGPTAFFTCIAHLYLYYTLLVLHTYATYIRH